MHLILNLDDKYFNYVLIIIGRLKQNAINVINAKMVMITIQIRKIVSKLTLNFTYDVINLRV